VYHRPFFNTVKEHLFSLTALFHDSKGKPAPERCNTFVDFDEANELAAGSVGPYTGV